MTFRNEIDPVNEALRDVGILDGPPNLEIMELIENTSRIHAGFLFDPCGKEALHMLCLHMSATKTTKHYQGWEYFAIGLGLNPLQIKCINHHFNLQDPAYYTLQAFVQKHESTLDQIVATLEKMERYDIIKAVDPLFRLLADEIKRNHLNPSHGDESGYCSLSSIQQHELNDQELGQNPIIRPPFVPPVPFVLQEFFTGTLNVATTEPISSSIQQSNHYRPSIESESYQYRENVCSSPMIKYQNLNGVSPSTQSTPYKPVKYGKKVMLTFAFDGLEAAIDVAQKLRKETKSQQRIGVVILNDHISKVNSNAEDFIFSCFQQVDYIIPIITKEYLEKVSTINSRHLSESSLLSLDSKYVKYIYTLMKTNFLRDGCINDKVRCVIPDKLVHQTYNHPVMDDPLFQSWVKQSETEELARRMLDEQC